LVLVGFILGRFKVKLQHEVITLARLTGVDIEKAAQVVRKHPVYGDEIHIDEELINLHETAEHYLQTLGSLKSYPTMEIHLKKELQAMTFHCLGMLWRMIKGQKLPLEYDERDLKYGVRELTRALIEIVQKTGKSKLVDAKAYTTLYPFMTLKQRHRFEKKKSIIVSRLRVLRGRPAFVPVVID
jgi:hypothetical protein